MWLKEKIKNMVEEPEDEIYEDEEDVDQTSVRSDNLLDDLQSSDWNMPQEKCTEPDTHCL